MKFLQYSFLVATIAFGGTVLVYAAPCPANRLFKGVCYPTKAKADAAKKAALKKKRKKTPCPANRLFKGVCYPTKAKADAAKKAAAAKAAADAKAAAAEQAAKSAPGATTPGTVQYLIAQGTCPQPVFSVRNIMNNKDEYTLNLSGLGITDLTGFKNIPLGGYTVSTHPTAVIGTLYLNNNNFPTISANAFSELAITTQYGPIIYLQTLNLSSCNIQTIVPGAFNGLGVAFLNLSYNKLTTLNAAMFTGLNPLGFQHLYLSNNLFNDTTNGVDNGTIDPNTFNSSVFSSVFELDLSGNQFSSGMKTKLQTNCKCMANIIF